MFVFFHFDFLCMLQLRACKVFCRVLRRSWLLLLNKESQNFDDRLHSEYERHMLSVPQKHASGVVLPSFLPLPGGDGIFRESGT